MSPRLDARDQALLRRCLEYVLAKEELENAFQTRIGATPDEVREILADMPRALAAPDGSVATIAINNALNEIVHGITVSRVDERHLGSSRGCVQALFFRWAAARGWDASRLR